jgi:iron-sulfur cluster repair protein YtfE (RIC family)
VATDPVDGFDGNRSAVYSQQLAQVHDALRQQLRDLTGDLGHRPAGRSDLLTHCLAFCAALTSHHQGEDDGLFSELLRTHPQLLPVVRNLVEDHQMIAALLQRVRDLADRAAAAQDTTAKAIRAELDGLAAIMESHFAYEERSISHAIDTDVVDTGWSSETFLRNHAIDQPSSPSS